MKATSFKENRTPEALKVNGFRAPEIREDLVLVKTADAAANPIGQETSAELWAIKEFTLILSVFVVVTVGCTTTAQTEFYRPPGSVEEPYRIGGKIEPGSGWASEVSITINEELVIQNQLSPFTNTTELSGEYEGKSVSVILTKVETFGSKYIRADVTIGNERAVSLTF